MARANVTAASHVESLLADIVRHYERLQRGAQACCRGTSGQECAALGLLGRAGPITVQEFAKGMDLEKTWASRLAVRLEKRGLVRRVDHPNDGRSWLLELTAKGREQGGVLEAAIGEQAVQLLNCVPASERAAVEHALTVVRDALADCRCGDAGEPAAEARRERTASPRAGRPAIRAKVDPLPLAPSDAVAPGILPEEARLQPTVSVKFDQTSD